MGLNDDMVLTVDVEGVHDRTPVHVNVNIITLATVMPNGIPSRERYIGRMK